MLINRIIKMYIKSVSKALETMFNFYIENKKYTTKWKRVNVIRCEKGSKEV